MFQNWLDQMNFFFLTHPHRLAELEFMFRFKSWLLMILMGYFLYLIYTEQRKNPQSATPSSPKPFAQAKPFYFIA